MPSIPLIDDAPASRANARPRGAFVLAALVLLFGHVALAPSASAQRPPCIPSCDPMTSTLTLLPQGSAPFVLPPVPPVMQLNPVGSVLLDPRSPSLQELCISRC